MYRRGLYYKPRRRFPLLPRELVVISAALVCGLGGIGLTYAYNSAQDRQDRESSAYQTQTMYMYPQSPQQGSQHNNNPANNNGPNNRPEEATEVLEDIVSPTERDKNGNGTAMTEMNDLSHPDKKELAMRLVSSAENSSLDWRAQFGYIEDIGDGRGYTAGIIGFCSGTGDMLELVEAYTKQKPDNALAPFLPALREVNGTDSHTGLGNAFVRAWKKAASDPIFQQAQEAERDRVYFNPAVALAKQDGLGTLGQFIYYDAAVMHGPDAWGGGLPDLRDRALSKARPPAQGGEQRVYLYAFLDARKAEMSKEAAHRDVSRVDDAQLVFLRAGNMSLHLPLTWKMYGDKFTITSTH